MSDNGKVKVETEKPAAAVLPEGFVVLVKTRPPSGPCPTLRLPKCVPGGHYTVPVGLAATVCVGDNAEFSALDAESDKRIKAEQAKAQK